MGSKLQKLTWDKPQGAIEMGLLHARTKTCFILDLIVSLQMLVWEAGWRLHWLYLPGSHDLGFAGESQHSNYMNVSWDLVCGGNWTDFSYIFILFCHRRLYVSSMIYVCIFVMRIRRVILCFLFFFCRLTSFFSSTLWGYLWLNWGPPQLQRPFSTGET